jgi:hypothetical protein
VKELYTEKYKHRGKKLRKTWQTEQRKA